MGFAYVEEDVAEILVAESGEDGRYLAFELLSCVLRESVT
jgi:hypothetical protein